MKSQVSVIILSCVLFGIQGIAMAIPREENVSVKWVCQEYPKRVARLFSAIDLERKGLERVKEAVKKKDWPAACRELLEYYQKGKPANWLQNKSLEATKKTIPEANKILKDVFKCFGVEAKVPRLKTGGLNWAFGGPKDELEWTVSLNRHSHLSVLYRA